MMCRCERDQAAWRVGAIVALAVAALVSAPATAAPGTTETPSSNSTRCPAIAGHVEAVTIGDGVTVLQVEARLDTGATTSSLDARDIERYRRNGENWVRFRIGGARGQEAGRPSVEAPIEAPVVREVRIRRAGAPSQRRPVVALPLCLAGNRVVTEFTLTDRAHLDFPILVGRSALQGRLVVDPGRTHLTTPRCNE
jgi:hypothetical protein